MRTNTAELNQSDTKVQPVKTSWAAYLKQLASGHKKRDSVVFYDSSEAKPAPILDTTVANTPVVGSPLFSAIRAQQSPSNINFEIRPINEVNPPNPNEETPVQPYVSVPIESKPDTTELPIPASDPKLNLKSNKANTKEKICERGTQALLAGGLIFSLYELFSTLSSDDKDISLLARWNFAAGWCLGPLLGSTESGRKFLYAIETYASEVIILPGIVANVLGWRTIAGSQFLALISPIIAATMFSGNLTRALKNKTSKSKHTRTLSESKSLAGTGESSARPAQTKNSLTKGDKIALAASLGLIATGLAGEIAAEQNKEVNLFGLRVLFNACLDLGLVIPVKIFSHRLDPYFVKHRNVINAITSVLSSFLLNEIINDSINGAIGSILSKLIMRAPFGMILAADQTIKTYQAAKKIRYMNATKHVLSHDPIFVDVIRLLKSDPKVRIELQKIVKQHKLEKFLAHAFDEKDKFGRTSKNKKVFAALSVLAATSYFHSGGWSGEVQFFTALLALASHFYGANFVRIKTAKEGDQALINLNFFEHLAKISVYPQTIAWCYWIENMWKKSYSGLGPNSVVPDDILYGWIPGDFLIFFGLVGHLKSKQQNPTEWEMLSEKTMKSIVRFSRLQNLVKDKHYRSSIKIEELIFLINYLEHVEAANPKAEIEQPLQAQPNVRLGREDDKPYVESTVRIGLFSKTFRLSLYQNNLDTDLTDQRKAIYTDKFGDTFRLTFGGRPSFS